MGTLIAFTVCLLSSLGAIVLLVAFVIDAEVEKRLFAAEAKNRSNPAAFRSNAKETLEWVKDVLDALKIIWDGTIPFVGAILSLVGYLYVINRQSPEQWFKDNLFALILTILAATVALVALYGSVKWLIEKGQTCWVGRIERSIAEGKVVL